MTLLNIAFSIVLALLIYFLIQLLLRIRALNSRVNELESRLASTQVSINGLTAGAVGVDKRLRSMEERESEIEHRQESIENLQSQTGVPYGEAIRLVQQGATAERLVEELGLSESEASLITMIHGGNP